MSNNNNSNDYDRDAENINKISRRDFLKFLAAGTSILALGGLGGFANLINPNNKGTGSKLLASAQQQGQGSWAMGANASTIPIHAALLQTGKIFYLAGSGWDYSRQTGPFEARVLDINTGAEKNLTQSEDLFCAGQTTLANGTLLLAGGTLLYDTNPDNCNGDWHGLNAAYEFNPVSETLSKVQNMLHGRWYPTLVTLADGKVWCYNGYDEYGVNNRLVEVYDPSAKTWTRIPSPNSSLTYTVGLNQSCGDSTPTYTQAGPTTSFYPRAHLMPSGLVVMNGFRTEIRSWNPATGAWATLGDSGVFRHYGTSFLLPLQNTTAEKGKILVCGGSTSNTTTSTTNAQILDFNQGNPAIRQVASTAFRRKYMSPVILPNGKCVIFGGTETGNQSPVLAPEMFDPLTETWQVLPSSTIARHYHSVALLLPDGRVWVASGTAVSGLWELRTEFFSPSYMGETRPTISGAPTVGAYGGTITIPTTSPNTITSVSLLRLMNTTHHYDANQRLVWLQIQSRGTSDVIVSAPINANIAPPGDYLIHVLDSSLVPSVGRIIKIPGTGTSPPPTDTTPPSQVTGLGALVVSSTQINLSWTANPTGDGVSRYNVYRGTTAGFSVTPGTTPPIATPATNSYSDTGLTASTTYYYKVAAVDAAGNIGPLSAEASATTSGAADTTIPTLAITAPVNGSTHPPGNITVTGTASDNVGISDVRVSVDNGAYQTATPQSPGDWSTWSIVVSITTTGAHTITANARDAAGNSVNASVDITISSTEPTPDTTPPNVAITAPADRATVTSPVQVLGTASDAGSGVRDVRVRVDNGAYQTATPQSPGDWSTWSATLAIPSGNRRITANARDIAGNFSTSRISIRVPR